MEKKKVKKPSFLSQMLVLTTRSIDILSNDIKKLVIIGFLPVISSLIIILVGKEYSFVDYESTKINLFSIVCAAIFIGIFNSLQEICKERHILKREYMTNLRLDSYICSKFLVQLLICFFQSLILTVLFFNSFNFPSEGIVFYSSIIDGFVTIYLLMLSASMTGLLISAIVKSADIANLIAPILILLQIVFSDALMDLTGKVEKFSNVMISKWGMDCLSAIGRLDQQKLSIQNLLPSLPININRTFNFEITSGYVCKVWLVLLVFSIVLAGISGVVIRNVSKDSR